MSERKSWKHLSGRMRAILDGEAEDAVAFVQLVDDVDADLLAEIANEGGGALVLGVEDDGGAGSRIVGCPTDDATHHRLLATAAECVPPLTIELFEENTARTPLLRAEVPGAGDVSRATRIRSQSTALTEISGQLNTLMGAVRALRKEVTGLQQQSSATGDAAQETQARLDELAKTAEDTRGRVRALARHLGADDKLVAWERRQLRSLLSTAIDLAGKRSKPKPAESDEVVQQVRKTWSKVTDWFNEGGLDQLQRDAREVLDPQDGEEPDDEQE